MELHDYVVFIAYPFSGLLGVLLARLWSRKQTKLTETAAYAAEVFDGWNELTQSYGNQLQRVENEVQGLRSEVLQLKIQLVDTGCSRDACSIRIPVMLTPTRYNPQQHDDRNGHQ
jgi:hypothetical protein